MTRSKTRKSGLHDESFNETLKHAQTQLRPWELHVSRVIHNTTLEKLSNVLATSLARPIPMIIGSLFGFVGVIVIYAIANRYGFSLSGFETIGLFFIGWVIGLFIDLIKSIFKK